MPGKLARPVWRGAVRKRTRELREPRRTAYPTATPAASRPTTIGQIVQLSGDSRCLRLLSSQDAVTDRSYCTTGLSYISIGYVNSPTRLKRIANRIVTDEYLDLYVLAATALVVAALGVLGIADVKTLASVTLALLAVLAYSQIRSRRHVAEIAKAQRSDPLSIFRTTFPEDLISRRATATSSLLIGLTMTRTVQAGSLIDMRHTLRSGGKIRIMLVDPTNDELVAAVAKHGPHGINPSHVRRRIQGTLDELTDLQNSTGGDLEIRVASFFPPMGLNVIDVDTADGLIVAQHYEHRPAAEAAPIFCLKPADGMWYEHFATEALRLWGDGTPWPLSAAQILARSPRPQFQSAFGPSRKAA